MSLGLADRKILWFPPIKERGCLIKVSHQKTRTHKSSPTKRKQKRELKKTNPKKGKKRELIKVTIKKGNKNENS